MADTEHQQNQQPNDDGSKWPVHDHNQPHVKCPRCQSNDTKFSYYNNYSLLQPRYFCRACKRYWTYGGALRKVTVGDSSSRKRAKLSSSSSSSADANFANWGITAPGYADVQEGNLSYLAAMSAIDFPLTDGNFGGIGDPNYGIIEEFHNLANFGLQKQMMQQQQQKEEFYKTGNESFESANRELEDWPDIFSTNVGPSWSDLDQNQWFDDENGSGFPPDL